MISRQYHELLPSYLNGENIGKHAGIIEAQDKQLDGKVELLRDWNLLERPILIEYIGRQMNNGLKIHCNTPHPLSNIKIEGDITDNIPINDEITTQYTYTCDSLDTPRVPGHYLPELTVTVTTTDGKEYVKAYPENDIKQNNENDHDEFLDIIGGLLNIQRRKYSSFNSGRSAETTPPYMFKRIVGNVVQECTEDDYYYYTRLKEFIDGTTGIPLLVKVLYGNQSELVVMDTTRWIPIDYNMNNIYICLSDSEYVNYPVENIHSSLMNFSPVTRKIVSFTGLDFVFSPSVIYKYPNYCGCIGVVLMRDVPVRNATLDIEVRGRNNDNTHQFSRVVRGVSDDEGILEGVTGGIPLIDRRASIIPSGVDTPDYVLFGQIIYSLSLSSVFTLSLDAWDYVKMGGTPVSDESLVLPSLDGNSYLSMGRGYLTYTPAMDLELIDTSAYTLLISFHAGGSEQRLGLVEVNTTNGSVNGEWVVLDDYLTNYSYNTTHTLAYRFLDGVAYVYLDGVYTGLYKDYSSYTEGMLYVVGYNPNDVTGNGGLYIGSVSVDNTAGITVAPTTTIRHDVNITVPDTTATLGDTTSILATLLDENNDNVTDGILDWTIYTEHNITLDLSDWSYAKLNGTSVPDASLIAPTVANGELSTGRGNAVYYTTPLPADLSEYTIRCKVRGTRLYNRIGISTITTNNDGTISIDLSKVLFAKDLVGAENDNTTYDIEFKFLNSICYVFVDGSYTGRSMNYSGVSDDLYLVAFTNSVYGGSVTPVVIESLSYVDCVDLNNIPTGGGGND